MSDRLTGERLAEIKTKAEADTWYNPPRLTERAVMELSLLSEIEALKKERDDAQVLVDHRVENLDNNFCTWKSNEDKCRACLIPGANSCDVWVEELHRERAARERAEEALRTVVAWREGPEGPETLFHEGAEMMRLVRAALAPSAPVPEETKDEGKGGK